jgi:ribosomal protein S12 methylthiotransferase accessory factor
LTSPKGFRDGTHRAVSPEDTVARLRPLLPLMGITRVANITGLDSIGIPVVAVMRPNARSLAVSQGKGLDLAAARASGLMESLELFHPERNQKPLRLASFEELRYTDSVIDVEGLARLRTSSYHPHLRMLWIEGRDLLADAPVWLPFELVQLNLTMRALEAPACFLGGSNGLASGNHPTEALSHAICEVVERDAASLFTMRAPADQAERRIDLASVDDQCCGVVLERFAHAGVDVAVWDITSDCGIPAFLCQIAERSASPLRPLQTSAGMGCHPTRGIALLRALTEAAQDRLAVIAGTRDDLWRGGYQRDTNLDVLHATRTTFGASGSRDFRRVAEFDSDAFDADLAWQVERLRAAGLRQVVAVDLTRPEFRVPVVHVVIPYLEPASWLADYVPGPRAKTLIAAEAWP